MASLSDIVISDDILGPTQIPATSMQIETNQDVLETRHPKRIACTLCRKRKLKCSGERRGCTTCTRLGHQCSYDEVRRKSGPKRGYVKTLEARIAQMENKLKERPEDSSPPVSSAIKITDENHFLPFGSCNDACDSLDLTALEEPMNLPIQNKFWMGVDSSGLVTRDLSQPAQPVTFNQSPSTPSLSTSASLPQANNTQVLALGIEEAMPDPEVINDLNQLYFEKVHPGVPIIHRARYLMSTAYASSKRPPICLQYAMWTLAAVHTDGYESIHHHFYLRARKYAERDEMHGFGEQITTIAHAQAWALLSYYEFKMTFFPRAWMSIGRASRLVSMMSINNLSRSLTKHCLPPTQDAVEIEQRRRTFWLCFCQDRYASVGTGWPLSIDERDVNIPLPCDDDAYQQGIIPQTKTMAEALKPGGLNGLSSFAGVCMMSGMFGRNILHVHRQSDDDDEHNLDGTIWKRHRTIDNDLAKFSLGLSDNLRLPHGMYDQNVIFLNLCLHTSVIYLHKAAIMRAEQNRAVRNVVAQSKMRCIAAALEIASIMRAVSHQNLRSAHPFVSYSLYVAATVFVQYLKARPSDQHMRDSLHFLISVMSVLRKHNALTEAFLCQLDFEIVGDTFTATRLVRAELAGNVPATVPLPTCPEGLHPNKSQDPNMFTSSESNAAASAAETYMRNLSEGVSDSEGEGRVTSAASPSAGRATPNSQSLHPISSHASSTSFTPPSSVHDDDFHDAYNFGNTRNNSIPQSATKPLHDFDGLRLDEVSRRPSAQVPVEPFMTDYRVPDNSFAVDPSFGSVDPMLSNMDMPDEGLVTMSDADLQQLLDTSMVDGMAWDGTIPGNMA